MSWNSYCVFSRAIGFKTAFIKFLYKLQRLNWFLSLQDKSWVIASPVHLLKVQQSLFDVQSANKKLVAGKEKMVKEAKSLRVRATHHTAKVIQQVLNISEL